MIASAKNVTFSESLVLKLIIFGWSHSFFLCYDASNMVLYNGTGISQKSSQLILVSKMEMNITIFSLSNMLIESHKRKWELPGASFVPSTHSSQFLCCVFIKIRQGPPNGTFWELSRRHTYVSFSVKDRLLNPRLEGSFTLSICSAWPRNLNSSP